MLYLSFTLSFAGFVVACVLLVEHIKTKRAQSRELQRLSLHLQDLGVVVLENRARLTEYPTDDLDEDTWVEKLVN